MQPNGGTPHERAVATVVGALPPVQRARCTIGRDFAIRVPGEEQQKKETSLARVS